VPHLRTTLFEHLVGTAALLDDWGCGETVALAGLCHAAYGTDGFATSLFGLDERGVLTEVVGPEVEAVVYLYDACDRHPTYSGLDRPGPIRYFDRFTGASFELTDEQGRPFVDLSLANELEILLDGPSLADPPGWLVAHHRWALWHGGGAAAAGALLVSPALGDGSSAP
jgi:hypothetical protein